MNSFKPKHLAIALFTILAFSALYSFSQGGGLRREPGVIFTRGTFVELTCGGTISANDALYLDSSGNVQRAAGIEDLVRRDAHATRRFAAADL